jgi:hypothetical protein
MAQKPDGKPARTERVTFTKPAAERIAKVVRAVEGGDRDTGPLTFGNRGVAGNPKTFRVCTFTGAWSINATKTVTFKNQTATPNTVAAVNLFFPFPAPASATDCAIAKDGTAWYLIDVPFETATAVFAGATTTGIFVASTATAVVVASTATALVLSGTESMSVLTDVTLSASLNTSACTISIGKTLVTASRTFVSGTSSATVIGSTATATVIGSTATSVFVQSTFTATFLRFKV